jgi:hypothetical protein
LLNKGNCPSKYENEKTFCICNGLLASIDLNTNEKELYTVGSKAYMIDRIMSVKELMAELQGEKVDASLFPHVTDVRPQDSSPLIKAGFNFNMQSLTASLNPQLV